MLRFLYFLFIFYLNKPSLTLKPEVIEGKYDGFYNVNSSIEYIFVYKKSQSFDSTQVFVESNDSTVSAPLMIVAKQQRQVISWQIPLLVPSDSGKIPFNKTSRTLCPNNIIGNLSEPGYEDDTEESPIISVSTSSSTNVSFYIRVDDKQEIRINISTEIFLNVTPSEPRYYFYNFPKSLSESDKNYELVLLEVNSDDRYCMTVSIQNASCPVFDLNQDITYQGLFETVAKKGGISIAKEFFPHGFFVVFSVKGDDTDCFGEIEMVNAIKQDRNKQISFIIKPSITYNDYVVAVIVTLGCIILAYVVLMLLFFYLSRRLCKPRAMDYVDETDTQTVQEAITPTISAQVMLDSTSIDETEYDTLADLDNDRRLILVKPVLYLSDLARKDPRVLKKKSYFYLWNVLTIAVFYGLPVVQLVIYYQNVLHETGNQDLCYYNFLCAHPLGLLSDFNHVFSNIGYVTFGLLFVFLVYRREKLHNDSLFDRHFGIPQHYGLYYAMGVALIMEGVLSGSYHICPNHSNFQFDSSFMYVMAVLCIIKLYQTRHPDINASAYATFGVLAVAILLGIIGILEPSIYFWIAFTVVHLLVCFLLTIQVYYFGNWNLDSRVFHRVLYTFRYDFQTSSWGALKPTHIGRMILLVIGNLCNWGLAIMGIYNHQRDFATYLLAVLMSNTMLYFVFYIMMKLLNKERINIQTSIYLFASVICASSAMYFFYHKSISWQTTPALSREFNQECNLFDFYDFHDIWHFLSAIGMFFTFMVLLTLDDDLSHTLRSKISVF